MSSAVDSIEDFEKLKTIFNAGVKDANNKDKHDVIDSLRGTLTKDGITGHYTPDDALLESADEWDNARTLIVAITSPGDATDE